MCQAFGFERKYATKLLTGNLKYKGPKGHGKTYSNKATDILNSEPPIWGQSPRLHSLWMPAGLSGR